MSKKKSTVRVKHRNFEEKKQNKDECIEVEEYKKIGNPRATILFKVYKKINPEPSDTIDMQTAQYSANNSNRVRFEKRDMSRPDEPPYFRREYMLVAETTDRNEIDELKREITSVENTYNSIRGEVNKKIRDPLAVIEVSSV